MLKYPIIKVEYYQIEFEPEWVKENLKAPSNKFRRSVREGVWEMYQNYFWGWDWNKLNNETAEILENWFKTQNI